MMRIILLLALISTSAAEGFNLLGNRRLFATSGKSHAAKAGKAKVSASSILNEMGLRVGVSVPVTSHQHDNDYRHPLAPVCPDPLQTLNCTVTSYPEEYWAQNFPTLVAITGTWVGRGVYYAVNEDTLQVEPLLWADLTLKEFYDPLCGCFVAQYWIRDVAYVNGTASPYGEGEGVGFPLGNFSTYGPPRQCVGCREETCLITDNSFFFDNLYSDVKVYDHSGFETNTYFNKSTGRVLIHETFRYPTYTLPVDKMVTTFQVYDDATNGLVLWNAYDLCFYSTNLTFDPTTTSTWPTLCGVINPSVTSSPTVSPGFVPTRPPAVAPAVSPTGRPPTSNPTVSPTVSPNFSPAPTAPPP